MFRRATEGDYEAIEALSEAIWEDDARVMEGRPPGWNRRLWTVGAHMTSEKLPAATTLVGEVDGRVVAAGTVVYQDRELRNKIAIHVAPEFRDQGLGEALFEALDAANDAGPYLIRDFGDPEMIKVFESLGFQVMNQVTEGRIDPSKPATAEWIDGVLAAARDDLRIIPLGEQATRGEIAQLLERGRQRAGAQILKAPPSDDEGLDKFLETALPGTTFRAVLEGQLVGAGTLNAPMFDEDPGGAYLVWVSVEPPDLPDGDIVVAALVAHMLDAARRQGLRVYVEGASTNPLLKACLNAIPGTELEEGLTILISDPQVPSS